jgi:hypothetical protein
MKLEWKDPEPNEMSWDEAKELEKDGWRLPTRVELCDAYDNQIEGFQLDRYWSSTLKWNSDAYLFSFNTGDMDTDDKVCNYYVKLCKEI